MRKGCPVERDQKPYEAAPSDRSRLLCHLRLPRGAQRKAALRLAPLPSFRIRLTTARLDVSSLRNGRTAAKKEALRNQRLPRRSSTD